MRDRLVAKTRESSSPALQFITNARLKKEKGMGVSVPEDAQW
jgi:hypothetical protein